MKEQLRNLFGFVLKPLESGDEQYAYKPSHRKILIFVSFVFSGLGGLVFALNDSGDMGYLFPVIIFGLIGFIGLIVGLLGTDRAVAKIWGNR